MIQKLAADLFDIDQQLAIAPSADTLKRRVALQTEFDLLTIGDAERLLSHSRATYCEYGEKAGRLLAHQIRRQASSRLISRIKDKSETLQDHPLSINSVFA